MNNHLVSSRRPTYLTKVYRQINDMIKVKAKGSELIKHNLEKGLSNEEILRAVLREILPQRYGIGKGMIGSDTLGVFIVSLIMHLQEMKLRMFDLLDYYAPTTIWYERKTKTKDGFVRVTPILEKNGTIR